MCVLFELPNEHAYEVLKLSHKWQFRRSDSGSLPASVPVFCVLSPPETPTAMTYLACPSPPLQKPKHGLTNRFS